MIYTPGFWKRFDEVDGNTRFLWFVAFIAIPFSALSAVGFKWGLLFGLAAVLSRELGLRHIGRKSIFTRRG